MTHFPSLFVVQDKDDSFYYIISDWTRIGWLEVLESRASYKTWTEAHRAGAAVLEAMVIPESGKGPLTRTGQGDFQDTEVDSVFQSIRQR